MDFFQFALFKTVLLRDPIKELETSEFNLVIYVEKAPLLK